MSRRTSEASKAVRKAWENEQQLVKEGKGTRDWTPDQQKDILEKGRAYGEDGKAFEGHHMKSAEMHPEYQGDPGNIQFLSRTEHQEAHQGSFRNPTNGYYDPITRETIDFGNEIYKPCDVINLSEPIAISNKEIPRSTNSQNEKTDANDRLKDTRASPGEEGKQFSGEKTTQKRASDSSKKKSGITDIILKVVNGIHEFNQRHPIISGLIKTGVVTGAGAVVSAKFGERTSNAGGQSTRDQSSKEESERSSDNEGSLAEESLGRKSPDQHDVTGYEYDRKNGTHVKVPAHKSPRDDTIERRKNGD